MSHDWHYIQATTRTCTRTQYDIMYYTTSTVAVPRYDTNGRKSYFMPRLAGDTLISCFGLTSSHSGSDPISLNENDGLVEEWNDFLGVVTSFKKGKYKQTKHNNRWCSRVVVEISVYNLRIQRRRESLHPKRMHCNIHSSVLYIVNWNNELNSYVIPLT